MNEIFDLIKARESLKETRGAYANHRERELEEMLRLAISEVEILRDRDEWLGWLEAAGVDNWDGYGEALELQREHRKKEGLPNE